RDGARHWQSVKRAVFLMASWSHFWGAETWALTSLISSVALRPETSIITWCWIKRWVGTVCVTWHPPAISAAAARAKTAKVLRSGFNRIPIASPQPYDQRRRKIVIERDTSGTASGFQPPRGRNALTTAEVVRRPFPSVCRG